MRSHVRYKLACLSNRYLLTFDLQHKSHLAYESQCQNFVFSDSITVKSIKFTLPIAVDMAQLPSVDKAIDIWRYTILELYTRNDDNDY